MARYGIQASYMPHSKVKQDVVVSYLPLSHIAAQMYDLWTGIHWGINVCFAEPDALKVGLRSARMGAKSEPGRHARAGVCMCARVLGALQVLLGSAGVRTLPAVAGTALLAGQEGKLMTMSRGKSRQDSVLGPLLLRMGILRVTPQLATALPSDPSHQLQLFELLF